MTMTVRLAVGSSRAAALLRRLERCDLCSLTPTATREALAFDRLIQPKWQLLRSYGFVLSDVRQLFREHKALLLVPPANVEDVMHFLEHDEDSDKNLQLKLGRQEIRDMVMRHPAVLSLSVERDIQPLFHLWMRDLRLNQERVTRLVISAPQLLSVPLSRMQSHTFFFHNRHAEVDEIAQILEKWPDVLDIPLSTLAQFHAYWKQEQLSDRDFVSMIAKRPSLLQLSFDRVLRPMIQYMIFALRHRRGARLFVEHPMFFEASLDDLSRSVEYLLRMGITGRRLMWMACSYPRVIQMDFEKELKPRVEALQALGVTTNQRLAEILSTYPELLTDIIHPNETKEDKYEQDGRVAVNSCPIF